MQSGMCQCILVEDMMTHPRRTLGKLDFQHSLDTVFQKKKERNEKARAKASVKQNLTGKIRGRVWTGLPMALCLLLDHAT